LLLKLNKLQYGFRKAGGCNFSLAELQRLNPVEKIAADAKTLLAGAQMETSTFKLAA
jgi:hypothetical protein